MPFERDKNLLPLDWKEQCQKWQQVPFHNAVNISRLAAIDNAVMLYFHPYLSEQDALEGIIHTIKAVQQQIKSQPDEKVEESLKRSITALAENCQGRLHELAHPLTQIIQQINQHMVERCKMIEAWGGISKESFTEQQSLWITLLNHIQLASEVKSDQVIETALRKLKKSNFFVDIPKTLTQLEQALKQANQRCIITSPTDPLLYFDALVQYLCQAKMHKKKADYEWRHNNFIKVLGILMVDPHEGVIDKLYQEEQAVKKGKLSSKYKQLLWGLTQTVGRAVAAEDWTALITLREKVQATLHEYNHKDPSVPSILLWQRELQDNHLKFTAEKRTEKKEKTLSQAINGEKEKAKAVP
jgi:hypothetical protein